MRVDWGQIQALLTERDQLRAELERARIPDGWKLVPFEFTQAMEDAGHAEYEKSLIGDRRDIGKAFRRRWAAMLAAAPSPGQQSVSDRQRAEHSACAKALESASEFDEHAEMLKQGGI